MEDTKKSIYKKQDVILSMTSDTFLSIQNKEITGRNALAQGKRKITGIVGDLKLLEKRALQLAKSEVT